MARGMPSMTALLALLAVAGYQNRDKIAEWLGGTGQGKPGAAGQGGIGGIGGLVTQLRNSLGGANAGGDLERRSRRVGGSLQAERPGGDRGVPGSRRGPTGRALRPSSSRRSAPRCWTRCPQQTGLSRDELLARLCRELPDAVDKYTPQGRLPTEGELSRA